MNIDNGQKVHPIGVVERRTGISPHVIRKWEERYAAVTPERNTNGRRLYSEEDIRRLNLLVRAVETGRSIGQLAGLPEQTLASYIAADSVGQRTASASIKPASSQASALEAERVAAGRSAEGGGTAGLAYLAPLTPADREFFEESVGRYLSSATGFREQELAAILEEAVSRLGQYPVIDQLIPALMRAVGDAWQTGRLRIGQEHLATFRIELFLLGLLETIVLPPSAPRAISAVLNEQKHTIGALAAAVAGRSAGWQTLYLGGTLPAEEIAGAARAVGAELLLLSLTYPYRGEALHRELLALRRMLPEHIAVIAGGNSAAAYARTYPNSGIVMIDDYAALRRELEARLRNRD